MQISLNKKIELDDIIDIIKEKLETGGKVTFTPNGTSMLPMLRDGEDIVVLEKPNGRGHLLDVLFYRRGSGDYVLHRVVGFDRDGSYVMCGDNQFALEHGVKDDCVIAVMTAFFRNGKPYSVNSLSYRLYINIWYYTRILRRAYSYCRRKIGNTSGKGKKSADEKTTDK